MRNDTLRIIFLNKHMNATNPMNDFWTFNEHLMNLFNFHLKAFQFHMISEVIISLFFIHFSPRSLKDFRQVVCAILAAAQPLKIVFSKFLLFPCFQCILVDAAFSS